MFKRTIKDGSLVRFGLVGTVGAKLVSFRTPGGLKGWFDPTDDSTITHASNAVSAWDNKAGTESFAQSTAGAKPTRATAAGVLNDLQHLDFDGGDLLTLGSALASGQAGEVWFVVDVDNAALVSEVVFSIANSGATSPYCVNYAVRLANKTGMAVHNTIANLLNEGGTRSSNTKYLIRHWSDGADYHIEVNGSAQTVDFTTGTDDGRWWSDLSVLNVSSIGAHFAASVASQFLNGQLGDLFVIERVLTTNEASALRNYLANKWGVTLS